MESLVLATIQRLADDGFDDDAVAAALNTVEFALREFNTGDMPRGLSLMLAALDKWNYGCCPRTEPVARREEPVAHPTVKDTRLTAIHASQGFTNERDAL